MNRPAKEWIAKAEGDYNTARRELHVGEAPNYDAVCFHAQQCVEKYLKSTLVHAAIEFEKTHDLGVLLDMLIELEPSWEELREDMDSLAGLAVEVRYPGYSAEAQDATEAVEIARRVRGVVRQRFGLPQ